MTVRKSKALRLSQAQSLLQAYLDDTALQQFFGWDFRFLTDMERKLRIGRKISRKQRNILDEKIAAGPRQIPVITDNPLLTRLQAALEIIKPFQASQAFILRVGGEMVANMTKGYKTSEKQIAMIEGFIQTAEELKHVTPLTADGLDRAKLILAAAKCYSQNFWYTHGVGDRAIRALQAAVQNNSPITSKQVSSAAHAVRGTLKKLDNPKFQPGDKCKVQIYEHCTVVGYRVHKKHFGIVIEGPYVDNSQVKYDILVNGKLQSLDVTSVKKR